MINSQRLRGGAILKQLESSISLYYGDKATRGVLEELLLGCSKPFLCVLQGWLKNGELNDPCSEFMLRRRSKNDPTLRGNATSSLTAVLYFFAMLLPPQEFITMDENTPSIFQPISMKILQIGALHNILRAYAEEPEEYTGDSIEGTITYEERCVSRIVDHCLGKVNRRILVELLSEDRLLRALRYCCYCMLFLTIRMCKRYYFLESCDLVHTFLDYNRKELDKPAAAVIMEHVQHGWECAHRAITTLSDDTDRLECYQAEFTLPDQLQMIISATNTSKEKSGEAVQPRGLDLFSLKIKFEFPDTLIFNSENLSKYELLFRLLFRLVDLSRQLSKPVPLPRPVAPVTKSLLLLRRKMLHFVQNLHQYLSYEVFEANWAQLLDSIPTAVGIDSIMQNHIKFVDSCLRQAMLTNVKLVQLLTVLFTNCDRLISLGDQTYTSDLPAKLASLQSTFGKTMRMFLEALQYYSSRDYDYHLGTLFSKLDYNSYYYSTSFGADLQSSADRGVSVQTRSLGGLVG